ncbi:MAG: ABC transporter permease [Candidatus Thorarchaeota archaeon]
MGDTLVSGILLFLHTARGEFRELSLKGKLVLLLLTLFTLLLVGVLVSLALTARSGIGIHVVGTTFALGLTMFLIRRVQVRLVKSKVIPRRAGFPVFIVVAAVICSAVGGVASVILPDEAAHISSALVIGGCVLAAMGILWFEGYPQLRDRGTPGYITLAGFSIVLAITYMTAISRYIVPYDPFTINVGPLLSPPSSDFPLGTTQLGQDMLSRTIAGGAIMLQVAVLSVTICFSIGVTLGLIASYKGGVLDRIVSLLMDSIFAFPGLVLAIAIAAMLSPGVVNMALAIAVVYIPSYFRVIRSQVLTVKELPYVEAAIVMGARDRDILLRYVLPNVIPSAVVVMSINFADAVLTAAGLTFIGLGLPIDVADWGWDLTFGRTQLQFGAWWVITFPGIMIVLLALGFTLAGEGLNEILTPKLRE